MVGNNSSGHSIPFAVRCSLLIGIFSKLVKMENPYKEPQKGCVLCNVTVDYKNIQVSARLSVTFTIPSNCHCHKMSALIPPIIITCANTHLSPPQLLSQFISPHTGKIYGRHFTGELLKLEYSLLISLQFVAISDCLHFRPLWSKAKAGRQSNKESSING